MNNTEIQNGLPRMPLRLVVFFPRRDTAGQQKVLQHQAKSTARGPRLVPSHLLKLNALFDAVLLFPPPEDGAGDATLPLTPWVAGGD